MTNASNMEKGNTVKGFTLLEILVSLSIISIVFVSLFKMQSSNILLAEHGRFNSTALLLARQAITICERSLEEDSTLEGDFGNNFPGYQWRGEVSEYQTFDSSLISETSAKQLKKITIEILHGKDDFTLTTWRYLGPQ